jgi:hypothetical protein
MLPQSEVDRLAGVGLDVAGAVGSPWDGPVARRISANERLVNSEGQGV